MSDRTATIIGAGIGGLTAALTLARDGWSVDIYEQSEKIVPVGAGLQLAPNASRILDGLGLLPTVRRTAVEMERLVARSGLSGRILGTMALGRSAQARWGAPLFVIHRGDLQAALLKAALQHPGVRLHLGQRLDGLKEIAGGVRATFANGAEETTVETGLLVGADGIWSKVRGHVGLSAPANFSGSVAWRTVVPAASVADVFRRPQSNLWMAPEGHVVHYPVRGGDEINIVAIIEDGWKERGWSEIGDVDWINRRFRAWHPDLRQLIGTADHWLRWSLFDRAPDPKWSRGVVTLLGDAAHPMVPCLAQGAAQAIEDAHALAEALATVPSGPAALKTYETRRISRTAQVQRRSRRNLHIYHASGPVAFGRDMALKLLGTSGMAAAYDWLYGPKV